MGSPMCNAGMCVHMHAGDQVQMLHTAVLGRLFVCQLFTLRTNAVPEDYNDDNSGIIRDLRLLLMWPHDLMVHSAKYVHNNKTPTCCMRCNKAEPQLVGSSTGSIKVRQSFSTAKVSRGKRLGVRQW